MAVVLAPVDIIAIRYSVSITPRGAEAPRDSTRCWKNITQATDYFRSYSSLRSKNPWIRLLFFTFAKFIERSQDTMAPNTHIPHLQQYGNTKQLVVNGKPYLMLGGELQNSSLSSAEFMSEVWPKMVATNVNTLLGSVSWEMIEPEEGKFDFEELDKVILGAREHGLHLILLWFGSFKNGELGASLLAYSEKKELT